MAEALSTFTDEQLVESARSALANGDRAERDASAWKWTLAYHVVELRDRGWTQARVATALDVSRSTIHNYERLGRAYGEVNMISRPTFFEALQAIGRGTTHEDKQPGTARRVLRDAPLEHIEAMLDDLPPERRVAIAKATGDDAVDAASDALAHRRANVTAPEDMEPERRERFESQADRLARMEAGDVAGALVAVRQRLTDLARRAESIADVWADDDEARALVVLASERSRMALDLIETIVNGQPTNFDAALALLLSDD